MTTEIQINITGRIATPVGSPTIICGNGDYTVRLAFDSEWRRFAIKTVRFEWLDIMTGQHRHIDAAYTGSPVKIPVIPDAYELNIGAYAGTTETMLTSTPARIPCERCITDSATYHGDTTPDVYEQLIDAMESLPSGGVEPKRTRVRQRAPMTAGYFRTLDIPVSLLMSSAPSEDETGEEEEPYEEQGVE